MILGAAEIRAKAGALAYIPACCVHSFRVDSSDARILNLYLPGGFERVITELGIPAESRVLPPADLKQRGTAEHMKALFQRVGMNALALPDSLRDGRRS